jgi:hypothetical protein
MCWTATAVVVSCNMIYHNNNIHIHKRVVHHRAVVHLTELQQCAMPRDP